VSEEFPLRGFVRCAKCGKNLTAGWARGRKERYAHYWCWTPKCHAVGLRREELERQFVDLLSRMQPTAKLLAQLPELAAREWEERKIRIGRDAETLHKRLAEQRTLNQKIILGKLNGQLDEQEYGVLRQSINEETARIEEQISALDSERATMQDLIAQTQTQILDLARTWKESNVNQRQEMCRAFFPQGLAFSHEKYFFEPCNTVLHQMLSRFLEDLSQNGVPDGI
jgi:site-specific DNA recombinase